MISPKRETQMHSHPPLKAKQLARHCDPKQFPFKNTRELDELTDIVGQDRAVKAITFGVGIKHKGFNLYVMGPAGMGRHSIVRRFLAKQGPQQGPVDDWCYVNNFTHTHQPQVIRLPQGMGAQFQSDVAQLIEELEISIPTAFDDESYRRNLEAIEEDLQQRQEHAFAELSTTAEGQGVKLFRTPSGFAFAPAGEGEAEGDELLSAEQFAELPQAQQQALEEAIGLLQEQLQELLQQIPQWRKEGRTRVKEFNTKVAYSAIEHPIEELVAHYSKHDGVKHYLKALKQDISANLGFFIGSGETDEEQSGEESKPSTLHRYKVNNLTLQHDAETTPIVYVDNPTYQNLVGRSEHLSRMGNLITDFTLLKPGALHSANGGYLIIDAHKLLSQPYAWEGLKRTLNAGQIRIESPEQMLNIGSTIILESEPIPLSVKVILLGDRSLYYQLHDYDPEFSELFRVQVDFEEDLDRNHENTMLLARLIASVVRKERLLPIERSAIAEVVDFAARQVEDQEKISIHMRSIADLLREADYHARYESKRTIRRKEIRYAIKQQSYRASRIEDHIDESIRRGDTLIDCTGQRVGQVNGLSVLAMGDHTFGQPSRISATTHIGDGQVIDIEREVELGGAIHSKGVLILSAFIASRYAQQHPMALSASITFEQSYGMVDGDSASMAELCAILSSLINLPVAQSLAITGSMNQFGEAQPIGGVNQKIEGFFKVCKERGLTGEQGVIIPDSNIKNLMLDAEVIQAVEEQRFAIYAVTHVDQALELLTNTPIGTPGRNGHFPKHSINAKVLARMKEMSRLRHASGEDEEKSK